METIEIEKVLDIIEQKVKRSDIMDYVHAIIDDKVNEIMQEVENEIGSIDDTGLYEDIRLDAVCMLHDKISECL